MLESRRTAGAKSSRVCWGSALGRCRSCLETAGSAEAEEFMHGEGGEGQESAHPTALISSTKGKVGSMAKTMRCWWGEDCEA